MLKLLRMNSIHHAICLAALVASLVCPQEPQTTPPAPAAAPAPAANPYLSEASITQSESTIHIIANSARPLAQVLDALRQKYGWVVDYEDPQYLSKADIVERPGLRGASLSLPAGGTFSVDVPPGIPATAPPPEDKTLQLILDAYNQSKNPGRFALRKNEDGSYALAGIGAQDEKGKIVPQAVLFDQPITLPKKERTVTENLQLICQKIAELSHVQINVGVTPRVLMDHKNVMVGGTKAQARTLLLSTLESTGHAMYWRLFFDPKSKSYSLSIHVVHAQ